MNGTLNTRESQRMEEIAVYLVIGAAAVIIALSWPSLYLRSRYFFWMIIVATGVAAISSVWAVLSANTVYWYNAFLFGGGFVAYMWFIWKKYSNRQKFFGADRKDD